MTNIIHNKPASSEYDLSGCSSIRGALFQLRDWLGAETSTHLAYTLLLHRNSHIRGDEVSAATLPGDITKHYWESGGTNTDPVVGLIPKISSPTLLDLGVVYENKNLIYHHNPYLGAIVDQGWQQLMIYPVIVNDGTSGFSALTLIGLPQSTLYDDDFYMDIARQFHHSVKTEGLIAKYFNITDKEKFALEAMAVGKTTADIAVELGLKQRAIELRLQNARKKLRARTTTEAVYKASAYAIIFT